MSCILSHLLENAIYFDLIVSCFICALKSGVSRRINAL